MHLKLLRGAATVAILGGTMTLGLGFTQAALASTTPVDCSTVDLVSAMTGYTSGDTLILAPHCTYWLTGSTGLPPVMHTLTIVGHDSTFIKRSYDNANSFSIFTVGSVGNLTLDNVNVSNGGGSDQEDGGAIYIDPGTVTIHGGTFSHNNTSEYGGAIDNDLGTLTVDGATFTDNSSEYGGAIYSKSPVATATLDGDTFSHNYASDEGGAIYNYDNDMTITDGNFRYNTAPDGGAIYNYYDLTITHTLFSMNSASDEGGAIYNYEDETVTIDLSPIIVNHASDGGGGIYNDDGTVTLARDLIYVNTPNNCDPTGTITGCIG